MISTRVQPIIKCLCYHLINMLVEYLVMCQDFVSNFRQERRIVKFGQGCLFVGYIAYVIFLLFL